MAETFQIDITSGPYKKLADYAHRIATLYEHPVVKSNQDIKGCLDELLGSVYSIVFACRYEFENRYKPKEDAVILERAKSLTKGIVRTDGKWIAGYHMNSSTYRTASVHHRLLKTITSSDDAIELSELDHRAGKLYKEWTGGKSWKRDELKRVHDEANHLKHTKEGIYSKRHITDHYSLVAIDQLLTITEAWAGYTNGKLKPSAAE